MPSHAKSGHCAPARANHVFGTDEKRIRTENTVMHKNKGGLGWFLSKIADCVRTLFRPCAIGDPRGRVAVRAISYLDNNERRDLGRDVQENK